MKLVILSAVAVFLGTNVASGSESAVEPAVEAAVASKSPVAVCESGTLPVEFQGTYALQASNEVIALTEDKMLFLSYPGAYMKLASCVVNQEQVITLTDENPDSTVNAAIEKLPDGSLSARNLEDGDRHVWQKR